MGKYYRIIDNNSPKRNVAVYAKDKNDALSWGASHLRTTNIRAIILKHPPKKLDFVTHKARFTG